MATRNPNQTLRPISPIAGAGHNSRELIEARQESQIWTTFALSPYLRANDLRVSVCQGRATLTGKVADDVSKDLATLIALGVDGVKSVDNNIEVQASYQQPATAAERGFGEVIDDATITSTVRSKMLWSRYGQTASTNVETIRGNVVLTGTVESAAARDFASKLAANTRGVSSVDNQLLVAAATLVVGRNEVKDIADDWITAKVKATLLHSMNVESSGISVTTRGGIVKLSGKLAIDLGRAAAIELAAHVRGVKSVDSSLLTM
jgi:hyperosmotically inducible protein